jgi:hypothetical protein
MRAQAIGRTRPRYELRFPAEQSGMDQDEAWCKIRLDGQRLRVRFHDYAEIYIIPGLYESLFYRRLRCNSPKKVVGVLTAVMAEQRRPWAGCAC